MNLSLTLVGLAALHAPAAELPGDGLDKSLVPEATPFLVHVDVRGLLGTELAQAVLRAAGDDLAVELDFSEIEAELGIDPLKDVLSVTVFSTHGGLEDLDGGVVLVHATARIERLVERARQEQGFRSFQHDGIELYAMDDEDAVAYVHAGPTGETRYVLISDDVEQVARAAAVLRGEARSLADSPRPSIRMKPMSDAFLFVEVGEALRELTGKMPSSELANLARRFSMQAGESSGRLFVKAELETSDGESARNVADVARGLISLVRLAGGSEDVPLFALDLLDSIDVQVVGTFVRLSLDADSRELVEELDALQSREDGEDW